MWRTYDSWTYIYLLSDQQMSYFLYLRRPPPPPPIQSIAYDGERVYSLPHITPHRSQLSMCDALRSMCPCGRELM